MKRGRGRPKMGQSPLSHDAIRAIRASERTNEAEAAAYGVDHTLISRIRSGVIYKHVRPYNAEA